MPRFTDIPLTPPPFPLPEFGLDVTIEGTLVAYIDASQFAQLGSRTFATDFHCVTTWSVVGVEWTGVPLREVLLSVGIDALPSDSRLPPYLVARSHDRRRAHFLTTDALADNVILATHLNGEPLAARHGGPLRLVAPEHYGYKSIKHLRSIDLTANTPTRLGKEHLRARVALEERHPALPAWLVRFPYRALITPTAILAERSLAKAAARQEGDRYRDADSLIASAYEAPGYLDHFARQVDPRAFDNVDEVVTRWLLGQPGWIRVVSTNTLSKRAIGDAITSGDLQTGTSVGSWEVVNRDDEEIVFGDDLIFMEYRFSIRYDRTRNEVEASTAVKFLWPRAGRFYFALVKPFHRRFVRFLVERVTKSP